MLKKKILMLGNEALARGAYEAGVGVSSAYPGTPSTEVSEALVQYSTELYAEWAPNEKVALEVAFGSAVAGVRSLAVMKHVGLNVAADPLFAISYTGVNAGLVIVVADDPGLYSSQNEQDTRSVARAAKVPVLEPADSQEAKDFMLYAYEISELYDTPVIVRSTTRLAHSQSEVELGERRTDTVKPYVKNIAKNVLVPANAKRRHPIVEQNMSQLALDSNKMTELNKIEWQERKIGVICSGIPYHYVKEVLPEASVLKLGLLNPLPRDLITEFAQAVELLIIVEELDPVIEEQVRSWGIPCVGKEIFTLCGEYSANFLRQQLKPLLPEPELYLEQIGQEAAQLELSKVPEYTQAAPVSADIPARPPILCPGCPHRSVFSVLQRMNMHVAGDIGCYTLGSADPLELIETTICMGASISTLHGMEKAKGQDFIDDWVAIIGDSTFFHTGINSLINMYYNNATGTVIIVDNSTTAMTGHQDNPSTAKTLLGTAAPTIRPAQMCRGIGIKNVQEIYAFEQDELEEAIEEARGKHELTVIVAYAPCVLLKDTPPERHNYQVDEIMCRACGICLRPGCPALSTNQEGQARINKSLCNGCGLCYRLCPFVAIDKLN